MLNGMAPATLLLVLLATACAALAHTLWGRRWLHLPVFWLAAWLGCVLAYGLGLALPLALPRPAGVPVLEAVLAAWLLIGMATRLRL